LGKAGRSQANDDNARAALVAVVTATGATIAGQALCAALLDQAAELLLNGPAEVLAAIGGDAGENARANGAQLLTEICAQCRLCPRGRSLPGGKLGPIGGQKWRKRRRP
jgi:hypothetical protein